MPNISKNLVSMCSKTAGRALDTMSVSDRESIAKHLCKDRSRPDVKAFASFAKAYVEHYEGITNTLWTNGEKVLIDNTGPLGLKTIFDVGANVGKWSRLAYDAHADAHIHAFEIVPATFEQMKENHEDSGERVTLNAIGLSDAPGSVPVNVDPNSTVLSSMLFSSNENDEEWDQIECAVTTGAAYCEEAGVDHIDFLKIDVEGAEQRVIKGFEPLLDAGKIRMVQFEYNRGAILSGFLLRDFYQYFEPRGYVLGKLYPDGVLFHDYTFAHEDFRGPNYVAVRKEDAVMIEAISLKS